VDPRLQRRVQRYGWDRASAHYEGYWARQLEPAQDLLLALAALKPGERVLDVACGTGLVTFRAAEAVGPSGRVVGTDLSEQMVEHAAAAAAGRGLAHVTFARCGAEDLSAVDGPFDAVLCALGLMYVPVPRVALAEALRVLVPGGRAVSAVWGARNRCGWAEIFPIVDARVSSEVCPMFFQLGTRDAQKIVFEAAGFRDVVSQRIATVLHYASDEDALGAAFVGGPVAMAYAHFDAPTREAAHAEYLASIAPHRRAGRYEIPGEFVVTRGVKP